MWPMGLLFLCPTTLIFHMIYENSLLQDLTMGTKIFDLVILEFDLFFNTLTLLIVITLNTECKGYDISHDYSL